MIEIVIVIAVLLGIAALVLPAVGVRLGPEQFRLEMSRLVAEIEQVRLDAIGDGRGYQLIAVPLAFESYLGDAVLDMDETQERDEGFAGDPASDGFDPDGFDPDGAIGPLDGPMLDPAGGDPLEATGGLAVPRRRYVLVRYPLSAEIPTTEAFAELLGVGPSGPSGDQDAMASPLASNDPSAGLPAMDPQRRARELMRFSVELAIQPEADGPAARPRGPADRGDLADRPADDAAESWALSGSRETPMNESGESPAPVRLAAFLPDGRSVGPRRIRIGGGSAADDRAPVAVFEVSRWSGRVGLAFEPLRRPRPENWMDRDSVTEEQGRGGLPDERLDWPADPGDEADTGGEAEPGEVRGDGR